MKKERKAKKNKIDANEIQLQKGNQRKLRQEEN